MPNAWKSAIAPLYLFACLVLGGSAQGIWENVALQLAGIAIIAWSAAAETRPLPKPARQLLLLFIIGLAVAALQLVPLPPSLWAHGPRAPIADGYHILGFPTPWLPLSVTPYEALPTLFGLIPPLALFCAIVRLKAHRPSWLATALLAGSGAGILVGAMQVASGGSNSRWYPYAVTNLGRAVGFFANPNHMANLLAASVPFVAALAATNKDHDIRRRSALILLLAGFTLVLIVGLVLNGSLAGYSLMIPVAAASAMILLPKKSSLRWIAIFLALLFVLAAVIALASSGLGSSKISRDASTSLQSREAITETTLKATGDYMPFGSGLGSFVQVYRLYESPASVTEEYVIHAHDDYAELALELGIPGILLMLLFLAWWARAILAVWRKGEGGPFVQAASIASAVILVHSLVDFPLRTAAIGGCFAMCLALLTDRQKPPPREFSQLRPTRHLVFT
ncbi:MAG TPA: O-antigen ligase family protein [Sphingomicrobium sp.]|nr:O-antigen ligase family protein [Sphingomicrobium sp.]